MSEQLIILDRDGVINQDSEDYIKAVSEWIPIPGSIEAIAALSKAGYTIAVATNQSGIGRGLFDEYELAAMHDVLCALVESAGGTVDGIFFCPHLPDDDCQCRKPGIGLLEQIETEFGVSVTGAPLVGDSLRDIIAARSAGCVPILVRTGKGGRTLASAGSSDLEGVTVHDDLRDFAEALLGHAVKPL